MASQSSLVSIGGRAVGLLFIQTRLRTGTLDVEGSQKHSLWDSILENWKCGTMRRKQNMSIFGNFVWSNLLANKNQLYFHVQLLGQKGQKKKKKKRVFWLVALNKLSWLDKSLSFFFFFFFISRLSVVYKSELLHEFFLFNLFFKLYHHINYMLKWEYLRSQW